MRREMTSAQFEGEWRSTRPICGGHGRFRRRKEVNTNARISAIKYSSIERAETMRLPVSWLVIYRRERGLRIGRNSHRVQ